VPIHTRGGGTETSAYTGPDRRGSSTRADLHGRPFVAAGFALFGFAVALVVVMSLVSAETTPSAANLEAMLAAATTALALLLAVLLVHRSRLTGDGPAGWLAAGMAVFGVATIGAVELLPFVAPELAASPAFVNLRPASLVVVFALLALAAVMPEVDTRQRPHRVLVGAAVGLLVTWNLLPAVADGLLRGQTASPGVGDFAGPVLGGACWAVLATGYLLRGINRRRHLFAWLGLMLAALTFAEFARATPFDELPGMHLSQATLVLVAVVFGLIGAIRELHFAFAAQSTRLLRAQIDRLHRDARLEAERAAYAERTHEARNALTAIEGATLTLERNRDQLPPADRARLAAAVTNEIARLQQLVSSEDADTSCHAFDVADVVGQQVALVRARGAPISVQVDPGSLAYGREGDTAQALQNVLVNAARHAPGSPVSIRAGLRGDRVLIRVDDRGAGIEPAYRERIFDRGQRADASVRGHGLGLYVARQLMRDQDGDIWVEARPGRGARFVLALPAALSLSRDLADIPELPGEPGHEIGHLVDAGDRHRLLAVRPDDRAPPSSGRRGRQAHHDRRTEVGHVVPGGERDVEARR
jgi:two-component system, OmpR family, sensor kinase